ncbi:uncharacterized protein LOC111406135 isoform X2 [Olea europaea var. sylvestris]|uniref:uncharacterized protein LOC111406135 isoform X2 n=1 Tax=Olea europaea var. sylvestris TaxID=158386 RepID=UPI000C1D3B8F|nr:uncharacterized protein LOC111406135 isoform X2 [Olea europaea var. sylvestris]
MSNRKPNHLVMLGRWLGRCTISIFPSTMPRESCEMTNLDRDKAILPSIWCRIIHYVHQKSENDSATLGSVQFSPFIMMLLLLLLLLLLLFVVIRSMTFPKFAVISTFAIHIFTLLADIVSRYELMGQYC